VLRILLAVAFVAIVASPALAGDTEACVVTGKSVKLEEVSVKPPGSEAFTLDIYELPVSAVVPARCDDPMRLHVGGALEFAASRDGIWLWVTRDITTADGMMTIGRGAAVIDACIRDGHVIATVIMAASDVLEGEHKRPDQYVRNVEIACDALTLDSSVFDDDEDDADVDTDSYYETAVYWGTRRGSKLALRAEPKTNLAARVIEDATCEGESCFSGLREIGRRGAWVQVEVTSFYGVRVRGWTTTKQLKRTDDASFGSFGCTGDHGHGMGGFGFGGSGAVREGTVRRDTVVYAEPASGAWGRFTTPTRVKVYVTPKERWATLVSVPGLSDGAYGVIPLDTVTFDPPAPAAKP
jgi:hypothetical protein